MNLNVSQLRTLRALVRCGTMVAVAEELGYTPGAVSQQIAALEKSFKIPLITRVGRRVVLTDAGVVLASVAEVTPRWTDVQVSPMTADEAERVAKWHYSGEWSVNDLDSPTPLLNDLADYQSVVTG